jgi:transcription elongation factor Elf1
MDLIDRPSAQSERKKGKWIKDDSDWFETMFKCSECGALIRKEDKFRSFFCYHCGADMRGEKNADYWVGTEGDEE